MTINLTSNLFLSTILGEMEYHLNKAAFKKRLLEAGYSSVFEFSKKTKIHRNTLQNYLTGKSVFPVAIDQVAKELGVDQLELIEAISDTKIKLQNIDEIKSVIAKIVRKNPNIAIILIGSRAKKTAKKYSDWDIGITCGETPLTTREYLEIKNLAEDASENIARIVEITNLDSAPSWFLSGINYTPIFLDGNEESYQYFKGVLHGIKK